ncbi:M20 family metallopeptidase [Homoserinimonas sp. OAct 916]|uniref:M20 family metallopeptidase n=1 Tax=Homoserinimonas sp. OAct 916 TaxID=2211450 RepID=UPI000DBE7E52|nr:M20 family metallopeptidase [Homoserinimonas sp. OAct 916]
MTNFKDLIATAVNCEADNLTGLSQELHAYPELAFEEVRAHDLLTGALEQAGFDVTRSACGLDTAFRAEIASGPGPTVAIVCEYDALPEIGHACGHNVIAAAGIGAAIAAARALSSECSGRIVVLGTPAEEGGGGKVIMIERGAFDGIDAAMMVHPAGSELTEMNTIAIQRMRVDYHGLAAHAAAAPQRGRNALDAAVLGYVNVAALRQHISGDERIHGIITQGGTLPNIVPEHTQAEWYMRSPTLDDLNNLVERAWNCLETGSRAAGCDLTHEPIGRVYHNLVTNNALMELYVQSAKEFGRDAKVPDKQSNVIGSTDMGNVSHVVPTIHPLIKVSPSDVALHTREFAEYAGGVEGDRAVLDGAKALGLSAIRFLSTASTRSAVAGEFLAHRKEP